MSLSNIYVVETTLNGENIFDLPWYAREIQVTNDSATNDVHLSFRELEDHRTLKPYETITLSDMRTKQIIVRCSAECPCRIWARG
jgi:hypothetical protein